VCQDDLAYDKVWGFMNLFSRKAATAGAMLALAAGSLLAGVPAANASGTGTVCPTNRLCLYFNSDFGGARADFAYSDAGLGNELFTDGPVGANGWGVQVNNNAASVINHTGDWIVLYEDSDCRTLDGGAHRILGAGERVNLGTALKNKVSSIYIAGSGCIHRDQTWA
jgi:hypothetical protein